MFCQNREQEENVLASTQWTKDKGLSGQTELRTHTGFKTPAGVVF